MAWHPSEESGKESDRLDISFRGWEVGGGVGWEEVRIEIRFTAGKQTGNRK